MIIWDILSSSDIAERMLSALSSYASVSFPLTPEHPATRIIPRIVVTDITFRRILMVCLLISETAFYHAPCCKGAGIHAHAGINMPFFAVPRQSSRTVTSIVVLFPFFKVAVSCAFPGPFPTSIPLLFSVATDLSELLQVIFSLIPLIGSL